MSGSKKGTKCLFSYTLKKSCFHLLRVGCCRCVVRPPESKNQIQYSAFQRLGTISVPDVIDFLLGAIVGVQWQTKWHLLLYFVSFWHFCKVLGGQHGPFWSGKVTRKMTTNIQTQQCPTKSYHYGDMEYLVNDRKLALAEKKKKSPQFLFSSCRHIRYLSEMSTSSAQHSAVHWGEKCS